MRRSTVSLPMLLALVAPLAGASGCGSSGPSPGTDGGTGAIDAPILVDAPGSPDGGGASPDAPPAGPVSVLAGSPVTLAGRATDGRVTGSYRDPRSQLVFSFSVRATGPTSAVASYTLETMEIQVNLSAPDTATVTMADIEVSLTGKGPIAADDYMAQIVMGIMGGVFGPGIRAIPLELSCGTGFTPAEIAALLVPWQLVSKYQLDPTTRYDDVRAAAADATCATLAFAGASPTQPAMPITKPVVRGLINLGNDASLPTVFGFFTLDGAGAKETSDLADVVPFAFNSTYGECNSMCRGACGADCEPNNCNTATGLSQCEQDTSGANTCFKLIYTDYTCGIHPGCIWHDDCYDKCNRDFGCGTFYANVCMHAVGHAEPGFVSCDQHVADVYGVSQGLDWAMGYGPFTDTQTYRYVSAREWDATACPCKHECVPAGTLVTLADGRSMPIEQSQEGDALATIGPSGEGGSAFVQDVLVHRDGPYVLDRLESSGGSELLVTPNHPIWTVELGYVPAADLVVGAHVLVLDPATGAGRPETLVSIVRAFSTTDVVYNLKTSRSSYVAAGILVHNKCLARGSLVDTPAGPVPIEELRAGDRVYGQVDGRRVVTRVLRTYDKTTILGRLPGRRLAPRLLVTENHRVVTPAGAVEAARLPAPAEDVVGVVHDLETESGNYWAQGTLLQAAASPRTW